MDAETYFNSFEIGRFCLGTPCLKGHTYKQTSQSVRYRSSRYCVDCKTDKKPYLRFSVADAIAVKHQLGFVPEALLACLDKSIYYLGAICRREHDIGGGYSLRKRSGDRCLECERETRLGLSESLRPKKIQIAEGLSLGSLCKRGHDYQGTGRSLRYSSTNWCVECAKSRYEDNREDILQRYAVFRNENRELTRQRAKEYYHRDLEASRQKEKERYRRHREKRLALSLKYGRANRSRILERQRRYYRENLDKFQAYRQSDRGKLLAHRHNMLRRLRSKTIHRVDYTAKDLKKRCQDLDGRCAYCGAEERLSIDHFIPISHGGCDTIGNIVYACRSCNSSKNNSDPKEWYQKQNFFSEKQWLRILQVLGKTESHYNQLPLL